jgi:hypothetical protein
MTLLLMLLVRARGLVSLEFTWTRRSWAWWATRFLGERVVSMWREVVYRVAKGEQEDDEVSGADVCSASWYSPHTSAKRDEMLVEIQSFSI